jgi:hypothetical protein
MVVTASYFGRNIYKTLPELVVELPFAIASVGGEDILSRVTHLVDGMVVVRCRHSCARLVKSLRRGRIPDLRP